MVEIVLPNNWEPRPYQQNLWNYLIGGGKRAVAIWHRRAGKDDLALHFTACAAMRRIGNYWHMLPEAQQCRRAIWTAINPDTGRRRIDEAFPPAIVAKTLENEMFIEFVNGSTWSLVGSDNYQSLIGSPPVGLIFSEWATSNPNSFGFLEPIINANAGWAVFITTPRGSDNHAFRMYETARSNPEWFAEVLSATDTGIFTEEQLKSALGTYIDLYGADHGEALYRQEYLSSWSASNIGSYFGRQMEEADQEGRIRNVPHDPSLPTFTAFDIGLDDATAIWFLQQSGREIWAIDYYEHADVGADHYARILKSKPYTYSRHIFPHDAKNREWGSGGNSRLETLHRLGVSPILVVPRTSNVTDAINATRMILPRMYFDQQKCKRGIECLRNYSRKWDDTRKVYNDTPLHDQYSHAADALRAFACSGISTSSGQKRVINYPKLSIV